MADYRDNADVPDGTWALWFKDGPVSMRKLRKTPSLSFSLLLTAMAVQGMSPDTHDLASLVLLRLLFPTPAMSQRLASKTADSGLPILRGPLPAPSGCPTPSSRVDHDGMPDEVCLPNRSAPGRLLSMHPSSLLHAWSLHSERADWGHSPDDFHAPHFRVVTARGDDAIPFLCRLSC